MDHDHDPLTKMNLDYFRSHYPTPLEGVSEALGGLVFYLALFHGLIRILNSASCSRINYCDVLDISNKLVSSTFAIITCSLAIKVFGECGDDLIHERHNLLRHYMCFAVLYFLYDTYAMFVVYSETLASKSQKKQNGFGSQQQDDMNSSQYMQKIESKDKDIVMVDQILKFLAARPLMIAHHLVLPLILFPTFMSFDTGLGDCLMAIGFLMEASTPIVSARKILSIMGLKRTFLYCVNGALMTIVFFCCRVLIFPIVYFLFAKQLGVSYLDAVVNHVPWFCTVSTIIIWLPQVYWWKIMVKGCIQVIRSAVQKKED